MNEQINNKNNEVVEIDLKRVWDAIVRRSWMVVLVAVLGAVLAFTYTFFFVTPEYQSSAMFYVNNSSLSVGDTSLSISSADITASKNLVDTYIVILNTRETLSEVIEYAGVNHSYSEVKAMLQAGSVNDTEVFRVTVTCADPHEAERIANAVAYILPSRIASIVEGTSAQVVDSAVVPGAPSSPSYVNNTMLGFAVGFILSVLIIILRVLFDTTIRAEDDILQVCNHPVLASVPDMNAPSKGGYYYGYGNKRSSKKTGTSSANSNTATIGSEISFAASEAYKLLRTKLQYSFADDNNCRVIGISSSLVGEGKSLSSVNLAYTLSQLGKKVLLIDCDMRRPSIPDKLPIVKSPGLSGYLSGLNSQDKLIQFCGMDKEENAFHVIASGQNPPNPIELLSSKRMEKLLEYLRDFYDYIILDLPPVGEVSDSLAVAKSTDGILLVVRQNYCTRTDLAATMRQFEFVDSRILGVIYNCISETSGKYGKKYYKRYYEDSYRRSSKRHAYENASKRNR